MRLVHVVSSLSAEAGGVARAVMDSAQALVRDGVDQVEVVTYGGGTYDFPWGNSPPAGLKVTLAKREGSEHLANASMKREIRAAVGQADVLHLHGMWEPLTDFAAKAAKRGGVPYVCSIHGMLDPWSMEQRWFKKWLYHAVVEKKRLEGAAALHFTAAAEMRGSSRWIPEGVRLVVVPYIVDLGGYRNLPSRVNDAARETNARERWGIPADARVRFLFLSRIHEKKGLDVLIDAMAQVPEAHLIVAGAGDAPYVEAMRQRARDRDLGARAHFVGLVRGAEKVALYRRAEVMPIPTSQENFGLVFVESLACETPVILTEDVDIFEEVVQAGGGAVVRREAQDVAQKIRAFLAKPEVSRKMGEAGRKWVFAALDPQVIVQKWRDIYAWAAASKVRGGGDF